MLKAGILILAALVLAIPGVAQTNTAAGASANTLSIPTDIGIVAKWQSDIDASRLKVGDAVQAQTIRDVKRGHDTLLKKGSTLTGTVAKVQTHTGGTPSQVGIVFDQVSPAGGPQATLNVTIQAIAPPPGVNTDSLQDGRGMAQTNINSAVGGNKDLGNGGELLATSVGVYGMQGVTLGSAATGGKRYSFIQSATGDVKIKKGAQVVFKPAEQ
jgi:hypothetical protein